MRTDRKVFTGLSVEDPERTEALLNSLLLTYHHFSNAIEVMDLRLTSKYQKVFDDTLAEINEKMPLLKKRIVLLKGEMVTEDLAEEQKEAIGELIIELEAIIDRAERTRVAIEKIKEKVPAGLANHPQIKRAKKRIEGLGRDLETNRRLKAIELLELIKVKQDTQKKISEEQQEQQKVAKT